MMGTGNACVVAKSTTMRMILGLDQPTAGHATVNGRAYADHPAPLTEVGALLDARAVHPGRTARNHLLALAATTGISRRRVAEVIELTGLGPVVVAAPTSSRARVRY
jgi:ABC-2 type transport system ATP-binding protein